MKRTISKLARSRKTRIVYSRVLAQSIRALVVRDRDYMEPRYPKKTKIGTTVMPDSEVSYNPDCMDSYNKWCEEYKVSTRIPK
jgi:hypothetical protein